MVNGVYNFSLNCGAPSCCEWNVDRILVEPISGSLINGILKHAWGIIGPGCQVALVFQAASIVQPTEFDY